MEVLKRFSFTGLNKMVYKGSLKQIQTNFERKLVIQALFKHYYAIKESEVKLLFANCMYYFFVLGSQVLT